MANRGIEMVKMDVDELLTLLNKALSDEWLAHYQYWVGSKVVAGPMSDAVATELVEHATEEMQHAELLATRIDQLGGTPVLTPADWFNMTNCDYEVPSDPYVETIIEQNIRGEQCAIGVYDSLMEKTRDADQITYNLALQIIEQEIEHERDLQNLLEDMQMMFKKFGIGK